MTFSAKRPLLFWVDILKEALKRVCIHTVYCLFSTHKLEWMHGACCHHTRTSQHWLFLVFLLAQTMSRFFLKWVYCVQFLGFCSRWKRFCMWGLGRCSPWRNMFSYMTHCSTDMWAALFCFCSEISNLILEKYVQVKSTHPHRPRTAVRCFKRHVDEFVLSLFLSSILEIKEWTCVSGLKRSGFCLWWQLSH